MRPVRILLFEDDLLQLVVFVLEALNLYLFIVNLVVQNRNALVDLLPYLLLVIRRDHLVLVFECF